MEGELYVCHLMFGTLLLTAAAAVLHNSITVLHFFHCIEWNGGRWWFNFCPCQGCTPTSLMARATPPCTWQQHPLLLPLLVAAPLWLAMLLLMQVPPALDGPAAAVEVLRMPLQSALVQLLLLLPAAAATAAAASQAPVSTSCSSCWLLEPGLMPLQRMAPRPCTGQQQGVPLMQ
jgi:hypothetical protein